MFKVVYWLHGQSKLFSQPQCYETNDREDFLRALKIAEENGYEIEGMLRELEAMPYDKAFDVNGNEELCPATGLEWFDGKEWWNEYQDSDGGFHYGR